MVSQPISVEQLARLYDARNRANSELSKAHNTKPRDPDLVVRMRQPCGTAKHHDPFLPGCPGVTHMNIQPIIVKKDVAAMIVALSESTIDNLEKAGDFPRRRKISNGSVGYLVRELEEWAESRPVSDLLPAPDSGYGRSGRPK